MNYHTKSKGKGPILTTATQEYERDFLADRRRREAEAIGHAIFSEIEDILPPDIAGEVCERILAALYRNGVLLVRDEERAKLGLESCDDKGWTASERVQFKQQRMEALLAMQTVIVKTES